MLITFLHSITDELKRHFIDSKSKWIVVHPLCLPGVQAAIKDLDEIKVNMEVNFFSALVMTREIYRAEPIIITNVYLYSHFKML